MDWLSPLANDAVRGYLADSRANPELASRLREVWTLRDALRKTMDELEKLASEQQELERLADETRRNLRAIEKNKDAADLRQKLTKRLAESSARLEAITKRSIEQFFIMLIRQSAARFVRLEPFSLVNLVQVYCETAIIRLHQEVMNHFRPDPTTAILI